MSSVSGISSTYAAYANTYSTRRPNIDTSTMAEELFSKLDSTGKGYIEESDLASALSSLTSSSSTSSSSSASDIFTQLDGDSDGKVTQDELSTGLAKLADSLNSQFDQMRVDGGMPPPPPPPPSSSETSDSGFTKDELTAQLEEIGSSDSQRSSLISSIVDNFDAANTNSDGVVSNAEAMAYEQSTTSGSSSSTEATTSSDAQVFQQLMALMRAYGDSTTTTAGSVSASA